MLKKYCRSLFVKWKNVSQKYLTKNSKKKWSCRRLKCLWPQLVATMGQTESCKNMTHTEAVSEAWNKPQRRLSTVTELHFVWYMFNIYDNEDNTGGQQYLVWRQNRWSAVPGLKTKPVVSSTWFVNASQTVHPLQFHWLLKCRRRSTVDCLEIPSFAAQTDHFCRTQKQVGNTWIPHRNRLAIHGDRTEAGWQCMETVLKLTTCPIKKRTRRS